MAKGKKIVNKKKTTANELAVRDFTINLHKRLFGVYVRFSLLLRSVQTLPLMRVVLSRPCLVTSGRLIEWCISRRLASVYRPLS